MIAATPVTQYRITVIVLVPTEPGIVGVSVRSIPNLTLIQYGRQLNTGTVLVFCKVMNMDSDSAPKIF